MHRVCKEWRGRSSIVHVIVYSVCVHGHNLPEQATIYGGRRRTGVNKRIGFPGGGGGCSARDRVVQSRSHGSMKRMSKIQRFR